MVPWYHGISLLSPQGLILLAQHGTLGVGRPKLVLASPRARRHLGQV